jgi:4-aminobutyrate aminotransferase-like enzyme
MLVSPCLSAPSTVRLLPPMVTTDEQLDQAVDFALLKVGEYVPEQLLRGT